MSSSRVSVVFTLTRSRGVMPAASSAAKMFAQAWRVWPSISGARLPLAARPGVPEVNSHLSGCSLRDYLTYLIRASEPIPELGAMAQAELAATIDLPSRGSSPSPVSIHNVDGPRAEARISTSAADLIGRHLKPELSHSPLSASGSRSAKVPAALVPKTAVMTTAAAIIVRMLNGRAINLFRPTEMKRRELLCYDEEECGGGVC